MTETTTLGRGGETVARRPRGVFLLLGVLVGTAGCAGPTRWGELVLPAERVKNYFVLECEIEGNGPYRLILDTGSSLVGLSPVVAARIGRGASRGRYRLRTLKTGDFLATDVRADTQDMAALSEAVGVKLDGILSFETFREMILVLDYPGRSVSCHERLPDRFRAKPLPIGPHDRPFVEVALQGRTRELLIDSGAGGHLALTSLEGLDWESPPCEVGLVATVFGHRPRILGRLSGKFVLGPLEVGGALVEKAFDTSFAGAGLLKEAALAFDQRRDLMWVSTDRRTPFRAPSYEGTGLVTRSVRGALMVAVTGAAKRAGLRKGDRVVAINGVGVAAIQGGERPPSRGDRIEISVEREEGTRRFEIAVEVLVR